MLQHIWKNMLAYADNMLAHKIRKKCMKKFFFDKSTLFIKKNHKSLTVLLISSHSR